MSITTRQASDIFNGFFANKQIDILSNPSDFIVCQQTIRIGGVVDEDGLAKQLFDFVTSPAASGIYYHYLSPDALKATLISGCLRFYSTKKLSSEGEFIPFCEELGFDGYVRTDPKSGEKIGIFSDLMNAVSYTHLTLPTIYAV